MAITKRHQQIQAKKAELRAQIIQARRTAKQALHKIPRTVVNGSHQAAVEYKLLAEDISGWNENYEGPKSASLNDLLLDCAYYQDVAAKMMGEKPLL